MPLPTAETIDAIAERLKQAVTDGTREPTAILTAEEHRAMLELHIHDPMAAGVMLSHVREHARQADGWARGEANRITFRLYERGAAEARRRENAIESATNVVRIAAQRNARVRRARTHDVSGEVGERMSPAQMLETDSPLLVAYALILQHRGGRVWHDEFYKRAMTDWRGDEDGAVIEPRIIADEEVNRITRWLHAQDKRLNRLGIQQVNFIIDAVANEDRRNAPRDWIQSVQWDGTPRLATVLTRGFGAIDTRFNREAGRCWFVSMVARVTEPGVKVDTMPVFIGPQGIRKSQALEVIGGAWYRAASSSIDSKDFLQELHGALVFEIPELHSMISSRHGAAKIKAVLSTRIDNFRLPYGLRVGEHRRTAVMVGSTNNRDWHTDETGGRRFWPVHCGAIDLEWLADNRAQLFAEANAYYQARLAALRAANGADFDTLGISQDTLALGQWWNVPGDEQDALIEAERAVHPWEEIIEAKLGQWQGYTGRDDVRPTPWDGTLAEATDWGNTLTVTRIAVQWLRLSPETLGRGMSNGKTISSIMRKLGWDLRRVRVPGAQGLPYVFVSLMEQNPPTSESDMRSNDSQISIADEEIPF